VTRLRRSGRISREIPIVLLGTDTSGRVFSEQTQTPVQSLHGAGILSRYKFAPTKSSRYVLPIRIAKPRFVSLAVLGRAARLRVRRHVLRPGTRLLANGVSAAATTCAAPQHRPGICHLRLAESSRAIRSRSGRFPRQPITSSLLRFLRPKHALETCDRRCSPPPSPQNLLPCVYPIPRRRLPLPFLTL